MTFERVLAIFLGIYIAQSARAARADDNEGHILPPSLEEGGRDFSEMARLADSGPLWTNEHWSRSELERANVDAFRKFTRENYTRQYIDSDVRRLLEPTDEASFVSDPVFESVPDETWRNFKPLFDKRAPGLAVIWTNTSKYAGDPYDYLALSLKNRMTVSVQIPHFAMAKADVTISFRGGASSDPSYLPGLHHFMEHMILMREPGVFAANAPASFEEEEGGNSNDNEEAASETCGERDKTVAALGGSEERVSSTHGVQGTVSMFDTTLGWSDRASEAADKLPKQLQKLLCPQIPFASVAHELDAIDTEAAHAGMPTGTYFSFIAAMVWRQRTPLLISTAGAFQLRRFAVEHGIERLREEAAALALDLLTAEGAVAQLQVPKLGSPAATFAYLMPLLRRLGEFPDRWWSPDVASRAACSGIDPARILAARARQVADMRRVDLLPSVQLTPGLAPSAAAAELLPDFFRDAGQEGSSVRWNKLGVLLSGRSGGYQKFSVAFPFVEKIGLAGKSFIGLVRSILDADLWPPTLIAAWHRCGVLPPAKNTLQEVSKIDLSGRTETSFLEFRFSSADAEALAEREHEFDRRWLKSLKLQVAAAAAARAAGGDESSGGHSPPDLPPEGGPLPLPKGKAAAASGGTTPVSIYDSPVIAVARCAVAELLRFFANFAATVSDETVLAIMRANDRRLGSAARRALLLPPPRKPSATAFAAPHQILPHVRAGTRLSRASPAVARRSIRLFLRPENMVLKMSSLSLTSWFQESLADFYLTTPLRPVRSGFGVLPAAVMAELHAAVGAGETEPSVEGEIRTALGALDGLLDASAAARAAAEPASAAAGGDGGGLAETAADGAHREFRATVADLLVKRGMPVDPALCAVKIEEERLAPPAAVTAAAAAPGRRRSLLLRFAASPPPGATPWGSVSENPVPEVAVQAEWRSPLQLASPEGERAIRLLRRVINKALIQRWEKAGRAAAEGFPWVTSARNPSAADAHFGVTVHGLGAEGVEGALRQFGEMARVFDGRAPAAGGAAITPSAVSAPGATAAACGPPAATAAAAAAGGAAAPPGALELVTAWNSVIRSRTGKKSLPTFEHWTDALDRFAYTAESWPASLAELEHLFLHWRAAVAFSTLRVLVAGDLTRGQARRIGAALAAPAGALEGYTDLRDPDEYLWPARLKLAVGAEALWEADRWGRGGLGGMSGFLATWALRRPRADEPASCRVHFLARLVGSAIRMASFDIWRFSSGMVYSPMYAPVKDATDEAAWVSLSVQSSFFPAAALEEQLPEVLVLARRRLLATKARAWQQEVRAAVLAIAMEAQPQGRVPAAVVEITEKNKAVQKRLRCVPPLLQLEQLPGNDFRRLLLTFFDAHFPVYGPRTRLQVFLFDTRGPSGTIPLDRRATPVHWGPSSRDGYATADMTEPLSDRERHWIRLQREARALRCDAPNAEEQLAVWRLARHLLSSSTPRRPARKFV